MLQACLPSVLILFSPLLIFSHFQDEKQDISLLWPKPLISCDVAATNFLVYSVGTPRYIRFEGHCCLVVSDSQFHAWQYQPVVSPHGWSCRVPTIDEGKVICYQFELNVQTIALCIVKALAIVAKALAIVAKAHWELLQARVMD